MTLFLASMDLEQGSLNFVNAGHDAPCVYRAASGQVEELGSTGMPLGLFSGVPFGTGSTPGLEPGDSAIFTTDGVWEVNNPAGEMLGKDRLKDIFREHAGRRKSSAEKIANGIIDEVSRYTAGIAPRDDVTLVVVRCREP